MSSPVLLLRRNLHNHLELRNCSDFPNSRRNQRERRSYSGWNSRIGGRRASRGRGLASGCRHSLKLTDLEYCSRQEYSQRGFLVWNRNQNVTDLGKAGAGKRQLTFSHTADSLPLPGFRYTVVGRRTAIPRCRTSVRSAIRCSSEGIPMRAESLLPRLTWLDRGVEGL